ncbi:MAG TPA: phosphatase PAP2 family protein [Kofleriaceae bacterium]
MYRALLIVCLLAASAHAQPTDRWYQGEQGRKRVIHLSITTVGLVMYPALQFVEDGVACRWCGGPNEIDRSVRNALVWSDTENATRMSDLTAYVMAPSLNISLVLAGTFARPSTAALMDDLIPIVETMVVTQWVTRAIKIGAARTRPYAHFTDRRDDDDNLSFPSGHTSRAFALATSAGMIARARGYRSEPFIWVSGAAIAATSAYLRIAADRHYLSDVFVGSLIGVSAGLTVPLLMRRDNVQLTATGTGIAVAGVW